MNIALNTLYVFTMGAYLKRDHQNVVVKIDGKVRASIPIHHLDGVAVFGPVTVSSGVIELCVESKTALTYLKESGRLIARIDAPRTGNVLLRREQFRRADDPQACARLARSFVAGKLHNARNQHLRVARESEDDDDRRALEQSAARIGEHIAELERTETTDAIRGREGDSARVHFGVFPRLIRPSVRQGFPMSGRSRRPPRDSVNALLSFTYALMLNDCAAGLTAAGLDPDVGFLHVDRPGRPSLALDLVEEFRTLIADRLVLALLNRRQITPDQFRQRDGGGVELTDEGRKTLIQAYVARKREEVIHPLLESSVRVGQLPFIQARLLARHLRGDAEIYIPCVLR